MSFVYPLGLLGLLAVPVLILIYILKNKYTEQVVPSTYLWTLSEKFLKRRNPINKLSGLLSLILQILAVVLISFGIAQPVFTVKGGAYDYLFILDGSGSMNITQSGETRLEAGKSEIKSLINSSANGSSYTLVYAAETCNVLCDGEEDKSAALKTLSEIEAEYCDANFTEALQLAQEYFTANPSLKIYIVTDKTYSSSTNAEIINVSSSVENYALDGVDYEISGSSLVVTGYAWTYQSAASLNVELYVDGSARSDNATVEAVVGEGAAFSLTCAFESGTVSFESFTVRLTNSDSMSLDNEVIVYNYKSDSSYSTLIISDSPFLVQAALSSLGNVQVDTVGTADYTAEKATGYGLYVFDGYSPAYLPDDGAVWFINPVSTVTNAGFSVSDAVTLSEPATLTYSTSTSTRVRSLLSGTVKQDISVIKYVPCIVSNGGFYTLLSLSGSPVVFAGTNGYGNREVVFAFSFTDTDITLTYDYGVLIYNLFSYTFPEIVSTSTYYCGDTVEINVFANCDSIRVDTPSGETEYLDTSADLAEYEVSEVGTYKITLDLGGSERVVYIYASLPLSEREVTTLESAFTISGVKSNEGRDGVYDDLLYLFILLAVIFIADWMVYCYEQYQLR